MADLGRADLRWADARQANLGGADLRWADLREADLGGAALGGADLGWANLTGANLSGVDLSGAIVYQTILGATNLSGAKGLESCRHLGPSIIDHRTLARSPKLPIAFLRGCGLPDALAAAAKSLVGNPIEFYSCFISYSTKDGQFAKRLHADLQSKGVPCWFAAKDAQGGKKLYEQIGEAIQKHDRLLLILSPNSMSSEWVKTEICKAHLKETGQTRRVLFPIRLADFEKIQNWECFDADRGKDLAREIREYFIPDFSNWEDEDAYKEAFECLLRDLEAGGASAGAAQGKQ